MIRELQGRLRKAVIGGKDGSPHRICRISAVKIRISTRFNKYLAERLHHSKDPANLPGKDFCSAYLMNSDSTQDLCAGKEKRKESKRERERDKKNHCCQGPSVPPLIHRLALSPRGALESARGIRFGTWTHRVNTSRDFAWPKTACLANCSMHSATLKQACGS